MADNYISEDRAIVLIDQRIVAHDVAFSLPRHKENQEVLRSFGTELKALTLEVTKMVTAQNVVMKFAGAGIAIWSVKQIVELVHTLVGR